MPLHAKDIEDLGNEDKEANKNKEDKEDKNEDKEAKKTKEDKDKEDNLH